MKRGMSFLVAAVLIVLAFGSGYTLRSLGFAPLDQRSGVEALAQSQPSPVPSPRESPRGPGQPGQQQQRGTRGFVVGTVETVRDRTLVVKVTQVRGLRAEQGASLSAQLSSDAVVLREIALTELKRGNTVTLRGSFEDGKFIVWSVVVEGR